MCKPPLSHAILAARGVLSTVSDTTLHAVLAARGVPCAVAVVTLHAVLAARGVPCAPHDGYIHGR